jgi:predicted ATPase
MHIRRIEIKNIRSIEHLVWELPEGQDGAGWHVLLGNNGAGKSTIARCIALCLIGERESGFLRQNWSEWLRENLTRGEIRLKVNMPSSTIYDSDYALAFMVESAGTQVSVRGYVEPEDINFGMWRDDSGWFSASYGPFRRFSGGDYESASFSNRVIRHLTIFGENIALTECTKWLMNLQFRSLSENEEASKLLENIRTFINQDNFLPYEAKLTEVSPDGVRFQDGNGKILNVEELSDGFRSILSMTFEIIRQLTLAFPSQDIFKKTEDGKVTIHVPGVVIIDEIDVHLHPTWQRTIGVWLTTHFPNIQFIVTTHSPLICHAAEKGSIYLLPTPGTDEVGRMIEGEERERLIYGNILDAYSTGAFGLQSTRSESSEKLLGELAKLNKREMLKGLDEKEKARQDHLRTILPTTAHTVPEIGESDE